MTSCVLLAMAFLSASAGTPSQEESALQAAAARGDQDRLRALLRQGVRVDARDARGLTPLLIAVAHGRLETARLLLQSGADVNASTPRGWTALMEAASEGRADTARLLLDAGANPDARDREAGTALDIAEARNHAEVVRLLRARGSRGSGKSVGDRICVRRWQGQGFCGVVEGIAGTRYRVRITSLVDCPGGCVPDADCSEGRVVGGTGADRVAVADTLWVRSWCITHTGLEPDASPPP